MSIDQQIINVIGAGGHGKVVLDALLSGGVSSERVRVRDRASSENNLDIEVGVPEIIAEMAKQWFHVAIGNAEARRGLFVELLRIGARPLSVFHPKSTTSRFASIGEGCFVAAHAVVAPAAFLGQAVIVNHGAVVDHDCHIDDFCHIAPHATLGGRVRLGAGVLVGAGATVLPGIMIGEGSVIGAGAVVNRNIASGQVWAGVPAKRIKGN